MRLTFIRHGKTKGNILHRYVGRTDEALAEEGVLQVKEKVSKYEHLKNADAFFVSPMKRCIQTAKLLFGDIYFSVVDDFREYDFGEFEGKNHEELIKLPVYRDWLESNGAYDLPAGEGMKNFNIRVVAAFDKVIEECKKQGYEEVVFVVHGGTIMAIFNAYDSEHKGYYDYMCKNAEGYTAIYENGQLIRSV